LNAAEWFRLGFLMDFVPPVALAPGQNPYTLVRKPESPLSIRLIQTTTPSQQRSTNLGVLYGKTGDCSRAELLLKRALDINEQFLGPSHPETELALNNLESVC
jgi:hypothetical protein